MASKGRKYGVKSGLCLALLAGAALVVLPAVAQESLLPEGFGDPSPPPKAPAPKGQPAPKSAPASAPANDDRPRGGDGGSSAPAADPGGSRFTVEDGAPPARTGDDAEDESDEAAEDREPGQLRYDLPPGARRLLTRIGPLTPETGGLPPDAFGSNGGNYLATLMRRTQTPLASRWGAILLRRTLLSAIDTPPTINGADLVAERAGLLLRMGESASARLLVQSVDHDRSSKRLLAIALQTYLANADPAGLCPYAPIGTAQSDNPAWDLASGMCSALTGAPGPAGSQIDRVRGSKKVPEIDVLLAERVLGAAINGRRSIKIEWEGVDRLSSWRFGLATATATDIPATLRSGAAGYTRGWAVLAPMTPTEARMAAAPVAAARGVLSNAAYVSLISVSADADDASDATKDLAADLRTAFAGGESAARLAAMRSIWNRAPDGEAGYAGLVLTAQAAAALPVSAASGADLDMVIASMLAGGYDRNALAWVPTVDVGSRAWGMLAVGLPRALAGVDAGSIDSFADNDDSADQHRSKLLLAALAGLGRIDADALANAADDLSVNLATETRWTRAIDAAAARGEPGTVALLVAVGMQGSDWSKMPPYHLYRITRALRQVGLASEARMIAAEALARI